MSLSSASNGAMCVKHDRCTKILFRAKFKSDILEERDGQETNSQNFALWGMYSRMWNKFNSSLSVLDLYRTLYNHNKIWSCDPDTLESTVTDRKRAEHQEGFGGVGRLLTCRIVTRCRKCQASAWTAPPVCPDLCLCVCTCLLSCCGQTKGSLCLSNHLMNPIKVYLLLLWICSSLTCHPCHVSCLCASCLTNVTLD